MDGASYFDPGEPAREVALVLLEATALPRRLAASRTWPSTLRPHEWQVLLAIGLGSAQVDPEGSQTPRGIAAALALDIEDVYDAVDSLRRERLAAIEFRDPEVPEAEQEWSLTRSGRTRPPRSWASRGESSGGRLRRHQRSAESGRTLSLQADSSPR